MAKKGFMTLMYRVQQSQALVSPFFWAATLTGVFFPILNTYLIRNGIVGQSQVGLTLVILFAAIFSFILLMGVVYDTVFKLWKEQQIVAVRRNPYSREKLMAKEIVLWRRLHVRTLQALNSGDPQVRRDMEFMERWIERSLEGDPILAGEVRELEAWVESRRPSEPASRGKQSPSTAKES